MDRREAVKRISVLLGVAVSAPTAAGILSGCQASGELHTLSLEQHALLDIMTEHIIPETDTPGARTARVADYIDAMLTDFYSEERRSQFISGLIETDEAAKGAYGKEFMACSSTEQFELLSRLDEEAFPDLEQMSEEAREAYRRQRAEEGRPFIAVLKELTLAGFYTSEVGATQELRVNPMGVYMADIPYAEVGRAWA